MLCPPSWQQNVKEEEEEQQNVQEEEEEEEHDSTDLVSVAATRRGQRAITSAEDIYSAARLPFTPGGQT